MSYDEKKLNTKLFDQLTIIERIERAKEAGNLDSEIEFIKNEINRKLNQLTLA
jgi:hypothetical protein